MPPGLKYTPEAIIEGAIKCVEEEGFSALSVRRVALQFQGSFQPIYSQFKTRKALDRAVLNQIFNILVSYTDRSFSSHKFLNTGVGIVVFAREHPKLFQGLCLNPVYGAASIERILRFHIRILKDLPEFKSFTPKELRDLVMKRWVYIYGLSTLVSFDLFKDPSDRNILRNIQTSGLPVISAAMSKSRKRRKS